MNIYMISSIIAALFAYVMAWFVYSHGKDKKVNKLYAVISILGGTWTLFPFLVGIAKNEAQALMYARSLYVFAVFCPPVFFRFTLELLDKPLKGRLKIFVICGFVLSFLFLPLIYNDNFFKGIVRFIPYFTVKPGFLYPIFILFLSAYYLYAWKKVSEDYAVTTDPKRKNQLKYIFSAFVACSLGALMHLLSPYAKVEVFPHDLLIMLYSYLFAIAIVRHQLMDIEVIIKKTLVFAGLFASVYAILVLPTVILQEFITSRMGIQGRVIGLSISAALIVLFLRRLDNFLIKVTDKYLFQKKYDYKEVLKTFTTEVLTVLDLNQLVKLTAQKISDIMKIESCGVLLMDEASKDYKLVASHGIGDPRVTLARENTLTTFLDRTRAYLSTKHQGQDSPLPKRIVDDMNRLNLELAIPIVLHQDMIGILTLGKKKSDEDYAQDDMDILMPLARTLAIAISNARTMDELRKTYDELGKTQAEAAQREKMAVIGTLSAGINHEICNPLGIARGQCEAFLLNMRDGLYKNKTPQELVDKAQSIMQKVINETDRATAITKRLSSFAKPSKGMMSDEVNIREAFEEVLALLGYEMKLDKIEVINNVPRDVPKIRGDRKQIQEVFFNLVRNAAQAISERGSITINTGHDDKKVHVEIQDSGHGISKDKINQIFNPFYTTKEPGKGTGLGLFIVKQVVERNKGTIAVKSEEGVGTTFMLEFLISQKAAV